MCFSEDFVSVEAICKFNTLINSHSTVHIVVVVDPTLLFYPLVAVQCHSHKGAGALELFQNPKN